MNREYNSNTGNTNAEEYSEKAWLNDNREVNKAGEERRKSHKRRKAKIDYSDKGEHEWYVIGAFTKKCRKCEIIKDITFGDVDEHTELSTYYLTRADTRVWDKPPCTWKGRAVKKS